MCSVCLDVGVHAMHLSAIGVMYLRTSRLQGGGCASMSKSGTMSGELEAVVDTDAWLKRGITQPSPHNFEWLVRRVG